MLHFVGALLAVLAGLSPCAGTAACVIISVKTQFSEHVKIRFISQLINVCLRFSKKYLGVLVEMQFQPFYFFL